MGPKLLKLKNYGFQKILGHKNLSPEKILEPGKFWVMKNFRSYKKFWVMKNFEMLGLKTFESQKN